MTSLSTRFTKRLRLFGAAWVGAITAIAPTFAAEMRATYYRPAPAVASDASPLEADLCVYTANAAGVIAAVQARAMGLSVILLNPAWHVGGLTTGGLSFTDLGNKAAIGGRARAFYRTLGQHYGKAEEWNFEPHVAERTLNTPGSCMYAKAGAWYPTSFSPSATASAAS